MVARNKVSAFISASVAKAAPAAVVRSHHYLDAEVGAASCPAEASPITAQALPACEIH